jgi:hypothetical protein
MTPLRAQLAPPDAAGATRSTITPVKCSNSGWAALTASTSDRSRAARVTGWRRGLSSLCFLKNNLIPIPVLDFRPERRMLRSHLAPKSIRECCSIVEGDAKFRFADVAAKPDQNQGTRLFKLSTKIIIK